MAIKNSFPLTKSSEYQQMIEGRNEWNDLIIKPMLSKKNYANGQKVHELDGDQMTYYFKNGKIKA